MDSSFPCEEWIRRVQDNAREAQRRPARNVAGLKEARDVEGLIDALRDEESHVRESAASALGALGDTRALLARKRVRQHDTGEHLGRKVRDATTKAIERIARLRDDLGRSGTR